MGAADGAGIGIVVRLCDLALAPQYRLSILEPIGRIMLMARDYVA